jgi:hypothetical protein
VGYVLLTESLRRLVNSGSEKSFWPCVKELTAGRDSTSVLVKSVTKCKSLKVA